MAGTRRVEKMHSNNSCDSIEVHFESPHISTQKCNHQAIQKIVVTCFVLKPCCTSHHEVLQTISSVKAQTPNDLNSCHQKSRMHLEAL